MPEIMTIADYLDNTNRAIFNTDKLIIGEKYQVIKPCCVPLDCVLTDISDDKHLICFSFLGGHDTLYVSIYDVINKRVKLFDYAKDVVQLTDITTTTEEKFKTDCFIIGDAYRIMYSNPYNKHIMNRHVCMVNDITEDTLKFIRHDGTFVTFKPSTAIDLMLIVSKLS